MYGAIRKKRYKLPFSHFNNLSAHWRIPKTLIPLKINHISHLTLHNIGFETRKIFSSEKFAQNGEQMTSRQNLDLRDSMSTLIKAVVAFNRAGHGPTLHNVSFWTSKIFYAVQSGKITLKMRCSI